MTHREIGRHFRAGAGTVIYNKEGQVALFKRSAPPAGIWQFQQGGIDAGEAPEIAMWRELEEETGLVEGNVANVTKYPKLTVQVYPDEVLNTPDQPNPDRLGQVHQWWFIKLKNDVEIDLAKATDKEFGKYKWVSWAEALAVPPAYKAHVYQELYDYFNTVVNV